jgi:hypothetical protein
MQLTDNIKLGDKSMIGILDPTRVSQASHTSHLKEGIRDVQEHDNEGVQ